MKNTPLFQLILLLCLFSVFSCNTKDSLPEIEENTTNTDPRDWYVGSYQGGQTEINYYSVPPDTTVDSLALFVVGKHDNPDSIIVGGYVFLCPCTGTYPVPMSYNYYSPFSSKDIFFLFDEDNSLRNWSTFYNGTTGIERHSEFIGFKID